MSVVYVSCPVSHQIHVFNMDLNGELDLLQIVDAGGEVQPTTISADKQYLYATIRPDFAVISYKIARDGRLTQIGISSLLSSGTSSCLDASGQFLLIASYAGHSVSVCRLGIDGLAQPPHQVIHHLANAHCVTMVGADLILVACLGDDLIRGYQLDSSGKLKTDLRQTFKTEVGAGPRHIAVHSDGEQFFVINELDGEILWYQAHCRDKQRDWQLVQKLSYMDQNSTFVHKAADITLTPDGQFLYVTERTLSTLACFEVDYSTKQLNLRFQRYTERFPRGFCLDSSGEFLIVAGQLSNYISVEKINSKTGDWQSLCRYPVGKEPMWIRVL
ncbi:MAG TPA: 6-phosphogluconolactonase [Vibrio sp.]|uniref:beta-propeller fold lactonase family protein n=1 Tax=Vibrio sp. TaxID=678 RepID=UPI000ED88348|nr:beta-propeller fold lactonase family protein [Vibrio sp.]HCH03072.1 6-phosphogluconolactonase [Vibrio sp.]